MSEYKPGIVVSGIVARRNKQPYIQLFANGKQVAQLSMEQARDVARNIEEMCARTEADAMILKFFDKNEFPEGAAAAIMMDFRNFRMMLDTEKVERTLTSPTEPGAGKTESKPTTDREKAE